uniref:RRM domain-containing protein n=1 Tax=Salarias fasciatus TaxID=181472 RepID=A0A672FLJ4_SALFA
MDQFAPINPSASLYVGDLHPSTTEMMVYEAFSQVGPVISVRICRHRLTRRSLGYGFVNFQNRQDGDKAMKEMNGRVLGTKALYVVLAWARPGVTLQQGPCMRPRREAYMGTRYQDGIVSWKDEERRKRQQKDRKKERKRHRRSKTAYKNE